MQAPILCAMAGFVAEHHPEGIPVARKYAQMAADWVATFNDELETLASTTDADDEEVEAKRKGLQQKSALACSLVVTCYTFISADLQRSAQPSTIDASDAAAYADASSLLMWDVGLALRHHVLGSFQQLQGGGGTANANTASTSPQAALRDAAWRRSLRVAAASLPVWEHAIEANPALLDQAAAAVFPIGEVSSSLVWQRSSTRAGTFTASGARGTYSVDLATGAALLDGETPSRLPLPVLRHADFVRTFGRLAFDVTRDLVTRHAVVGRWYRFAAPQRDMLYVFEQRGAASQQDDELELLPGAHLRSLNQFPHL